MDEPTIEVISELSDLVKLELTDFEKASLVGHFYKLISFIDQIKSVSITDTHNYSSTQGKQLRDDDVIQAKSITETPTFQVPRIVP